MSAPRTLTFFGGAATATGSMILLEAAGARVLLDAGLFQGNVAQAAEKNRDLPLDPARVDAILLSDAGLAASGRTPQLVRHGFHGPVYATPATRDCAAILLSETALELETAGPQQLYGLSDVTARGRAALSSGAASAPQPGLRVHGSGAHAGIRQHRAADRGGWVTSHRLFRRRGPARLGNLPRSGPGSG